MILHWNDPLARHKTRAHQILLRTLHVRGTSTASAGSVNDCFPGFGMLGQGLEVGFTAAIRFRGTAGRGHQGEASVHVIVADKAAVAGH